ncbi:MAG: FAD-dependent oxidoreductase [Gemmatimonadota bacterium]
MFDRSSTPRRESSAHVAAVRRPSSPVSLPESAARATQRRDLRTGRSLWQDSAGRSVRAQQLRGDIAAEVAVVGAGISGAIMAYTLARRGVSTIVLDRREPVHGSTMASTALLQFEIDVSLSELSERIGTARARRAWRRSVQGVRALGRLVADARIACDYAPRHSLYLSGDVYGARALMHEALARARAGIPGQFLDHAAVARRFGIERTGAIVSPGSAVANPAQLAAGLLRHAARDGAQIYSPADVQGVTASRNGVQLFTASGATVHVTDAIFCTGYELPHSLELAGHSVKSTWAVAAEPRDVMPAWLATTVVWEASDPYLYLRSTGDGSLVAGGEDEASATRHGNRTVLVRKAARIVGNVEALLPGIDLRRTHAWGGAFGESSTGLPIIDRLPGQPHCHVVAGFGGNGITYSMIAAQVTSARLRGRRDPDADLYRAPR